MIQAFIFDLDGTLVDTEPLKNEAYVRAALELSADGLTPEQVLAVATEYIGVPEPETVMGIVQRLGLEEAARERMPEFGAHTPWQVYSELQFSAYRRLLDEPGLLLRSQLPHAVTLLRKVRRQGYPTGLATMSYRRDVQRILQELHWTCLFDVVVTADDVQRGKPDPEIYLRAARALAVQPAECLVIEDSPSGIAGALAAGMRCIAVPSTLTLRAVRSARLLDERWIVTDPSQLEAVVSQMLRHIAGASLADSQR